MREAYQVPFNSFWEILKGESEAECTSRYWGWHSAPGSHWIQVKDTDANEVLGVCEWIIHESIPYQNGNPIPPGDWWTDGRAGLLASLLEIAANSCLANMRDITDQALHTFFTRRPATMSKPHIRKRHILDLSTTEQFSHTADSM